MLVNQDHRYLDNMDFVLHLTCQYVVYILCCKALEIIVVLVCFILGFFLYTVFHNVNHSIIGTSPYILELHIIDFHYINIWPIYLFPSDMEICVDEVIDYL